MTFWKSVPGMIVLILAVAAATACGIVVVLVKDVAHPKRAVEDTHPKDVESRRLLQEFVATRERDPAVRERLARCVP